MLELEVLQEYFSSQGMLRIGYRFTPDGYMPVWLHINDNLRDVNPNNPIMSNSEGFEPSDHFKDWYIKRELDKWISS